LQETKSGLAVALIGLLSENNRAGRSEEQPGLALKCYEEAKSFGSDVGQVFLFEARDEHRKGYTAKGADNLAMGDHVVNNVSKFSKPASAAAEVDELPIDAVNYLPGCMREDLQVGFGKTLGCAYGCSIVSVNGVGMVVT
jgi:hypothetical protein